MWCRGDVEGVKKLVGRNVKLELWTLSEPIGGPLIRPEVIATLCDAFALLVGRAERSCP